MLIFLRTVGLLLLKTGEPTFFSLRPAYTETEVGVTEAVIRLDDLC